MVIVKATIGIGNCGEVMDTEEADILINLSEKVAGEMIDKDPLALADLISDELGLPVVEIIGYKEPNYIINI